MVLCISMNLIDGDASGSGQTPRSSTTGPIVANAFSDSSLAASLRKNFQNIHTKKNNKHKIVKFLQEISLLFNKEHKILCLLHFHPECFNCCILRRFSGHFLNNFTSTPLHTFQIFTTNRGYIKSRQHIVDFVRAAYAVYHSCKSHLHVY